MIKQNFEIIYREFRLQLYQHIFEMIGERAGSLSATEFFSAEVIYLLKNPTITEFADYLKISLPNAAYKIKSLLEKGYICKEQTSDKRTFRIHVTDKFTKYYHSSDSYGSFILSKQKKRLNEQELKNVDFIFQQFIEQMNLEKENENV